ncbi:MAG: hypothetical protein CVU00_12445 [Bacteroidetes bacterium HGW-Bacteroidetes-17]|nr:MAG: hypothetical protein CVU00_12445 [Bacteroidetes bacterium HGW-Bacteroidetes-17]
MKKLTFKSLILALIMFPLMLSAQSSSIDKLFDKYSGQDGFTSVNISKSMFAFFAKMEGIEDSDLNQMQGVLDNLDGLKILSCDSQNSTRLEEFRKSLNASLKDKNFEELMVMKENGQEVKFMTKTVGKDIVELMLVASENGEVTVLSFFGIIDLQAISKLSKTVKINGMDKLNSLDKYKK